MNEQTHGFSAGKLAAGMALLAVGIAGVMQAHEIWRYWPLLLIFIGLGQEADAWRTRRDSGGIFLIAVGVWMLAGSLHLFGLDYDDAFPVGVMVVGLGLVSHALLGIRSKKKELPREQQ
jgi:hypothetical protein